MAKLQDQINDVQEQIGIITNLVDDIGAVIPTDDTVKQWDKKIKDAKRCVRRLS